MPQQVIPAVQQSFNPGSEKAMYERTTKVESSKMSAVDTINALLEDTRSDVTVIVSILETLKAEGGNEFAKGAEKCGDACRQRELPPPAFSIFTGKIFYTDGGLTVMMG